MNFRKAGEAVAQLDANIGDVGGPFGVARSLKVTGSAHGCATGPLDGRQAIFSMTGRSDWSDLRH
jgi:hypothetical protein